MIANDWQNDKYVKNWMELLGNERTEENYKRDFPKFLEWIAADNGDGQPNTPYRTPTDIIDSRLQHLTTVDIVKRQYWEKVVIKYKNYLQTVRQENGKPYRMATIHGHLRTVQSFFSKNGAKLQFSRGDLKINPSEADKVDNEWTPTNEDVRLLYRLADGARDRAILLTLYQSGFSEVDTAQMMIESFPFYNENGNWALDSTEDLYRKQRREKTNEWQQTCLSREALEEIRIMLQNRGFPKEGYLFVSFRGEPLGVRGINEIFKGSYGTVKGECIKKMGLVEKAFNGKSKLWQTKHLRDAYKNGLIKAKLPQELIDVMFGHRRQGAKNDYSIAEDTIRESYKEAFKFLTINGYGSQARKIEELQKKQDEDRKHLEAKMQEDHDALMTVIKQQQKTIDEKTKKITDMLSDANKIVASMTTVLESLQAERKQREETEKWLNSLSDEELAERTAKMVKHAHDIAKTKRENP
jgi:hypothetical protein